jgi:hypothetical protein
MLTTLGDQCLSCFTRKAGMWRLKEIKKNKDEQRTGIKISAENIFEHLI